jgi:hypothetical protein
MRTRLAPHDSVVGLDRDADGIRATEAREIRAERGRSLR